MSMTGEEIFNLIGVGLGVVVFSWFGLIYPIIQWIRRRRGELEEASASPAPQRPPEPRQIVLTQKEWLKIINDLPNLYPVLFLHGSQGTGKTTILRAILATRKGGIVLFAVKPDDAWEFDHFTIDDDGSFTTIEVALVATLQHVKQRIADYKAGIRHEPITIVVDDALVVRDMCQDAYDALVQYVATVGRSYGVRLILCLHSKNGVVAGFKGKTDMLTGFLKLILSRNHQAILRDESENEEASINTRGVRKLARRTLAGRAFVIPVERSENDELLNVAFGLSQAIEPDTERSGSGSFGSENGDVPAANGNLSMTPNELSRLTRAIQMHAAGATKETAICTAFECRKGSSKTYRRAVELFGAAVE
ncbi:MAG: hypothetical protein HC884_00965 [Chloroflexaceae bacterium]|nr:hypothetical protein [Chloroflexaceae bacterium]